MTQPGETEGFTVEDHLAVISSYSGDMPIDVALINSTTISDPLREKYLADGAEPVVLPSGSSDRAIPSVKRLVCGDLLCERQVVRHDPAKLADMLLGIYKTQNVEAYCNV
jgi:2-phospho-L-lactate transferase/gluconeogenesis factor (CofD/UPF0052 family)